MSLLDTLIGPVTGILERLIPDATERAKAAHEIATMAERQAHETVMAQIDANKEAAKHPSMFVAGARPATLWICNAGLAYAIVLSPILDIWFTVPEVDLSILLTLLGGLLGLSGMRMGEKINGVARENMRKTL
jgi:hypothetical protein